MHEINTDILIIGGGSAGISAAVGASQFGNKVTLIEQLSYLGGKATSAEVGTVCGLYKYSKTEKAEYIVKGFAKDFAEQLSELSQTVPLNNNNGLHYLPYNIEAYKDLCLDIIKKNNVELFLNSEVIHVQISNQHLKSVTIKTATEVFEINYKTIVDCSGNGQISQLTNLPLITSDKYQAAAQIFTLSGINDITETNLNFIVMKELQKAVYDKTLNRNSY
jgi:flavin-dependent dehydrogenase